jgi:hypothetical protein
MEFCKGMGLLQYDIQGRRTRTNKSPVNKYQPSINQRRKMMRDVAELMKLADYIENNVSDNEFDMRHWDRCIVGQYKNMKGFGFILSASEVGDRLGMAGYEQIKLFFGVSHDDLKRVDLSSLSRAQAVATIRHFAVTGVVDWKAKPTKEVESTIFNRLFGVRKPVVQSGSLELT